MNDFQKTIEMSPAFDKRDPDPKKNHGIHGVDICFLLKGPKGAVHFLLSTNWQLPHVSEEAHQRILNAARNGVSDSYAGTSGELSLCLLEVLYAPRPVSRGYHSPVPMYDNQQLSHVEGCPYLDGKPCYCDASFTNAQGIYDALVTEGSDGVWKELEYYYHDVFDQPIENRTVEGIELGVLLDAMLGNVRENE